MDTPDIHWILYTVLFTCIVQQQPNFPLMIGISHPNQKSNIHFPFAQMIKR